MLCYARFTVESVPLERLFPFRYTETRRFLFEFKVSGIIRIRETPLSPPLCNFITHTAHYVHHGFYAKRVRNARAIARLRLHGKSRLNGKKGKCARSIWIDSEYICENIVQPMLFDIRPNLSDLCRTCPNTRTIRNNNE